MRPEDCKLLEKARPDLMKTVDLEGSCLLGELRARGALRAEQEEIIKVVSAIKRQ